jgi:hypothetical protein
MFVSNTNFTSRYQVFHQVILSPSSYKHHALVSASSLLPRHVHLHDRSVDDRKVFHKENIPSLSHFTVHGTTASSIGETAAGCILRRRSELQYLLGTTITIDEVEIESRSLFLAM